MHGVLGSVGLHGLDIHVYSRGCFLQEPFGIAADDGRQRRPGVVAGDALDAALPVFVLPVVHAFEGRGDGEGVGWVVDGDGGGWVDLGVGLSGIVCGREGGLEFVGSRRRWREGEYQSRCRTWWAALGLDG